MVLPGSPLICLFTNEIDFDADSRSQELLFDIGADEYVP